ncbi:MAG: DUF262 domain-containing HNH endonuclease family protein [Treponema sp.]|nr:DUF262 domain-containing HNH endonuclease family protein [Treponema sp.]
MNNPEKENLIEEIAVYGNNKNIFDDNGIEYIIPLYQRSFAWEENHIYKLLEDINDFREESYYLGSLIVSKSVDKNVYEVIDGQQRLTALFLLFASLKIDFNYNALTFACRKKSDNTLKNIRNLDNLEDANIDSGLLSGKKIIDGIINGNINEQKFDEEFFLSQLMKVKLYRIQVPPNTDLNRYFETMNTRGEQLEQSDILKANLMGKITSEIDRDLFAEIWEACSDMTGYVQMNFNNTDTRSELFGDSWNDLPQIKFNCERINNIKNSDSLQIKNIINGKYDSNKDVNNEDINKKERVKFESVISFQFFILHALKIFVADKKILHYMPNKTLINEMLDDNKLSETFKIVINDGIIDGKRISEMKESFSLDFIQCMLKCRFLFDKYIIKREFANDNSDGEWSLKQLEVSSQGKSKSPYYVNTLFKGKEELEQKLEHKTNLMLQSCLRVSYTSPKIMHWITELLKWLYLDNYMNLKLLNKYKLKTETIAAMAVKANYLDKILDKNYNWGANTPHIVFNYLDFLLWEGNKDKHSNFVFEFRNSVEHWHPRNPSAETFEQWSNDDVNGFGNLCIIQRGINSKFSNMSPEAKKSTFIQMIEKASLKLRIMSGLTLPATGEKSGCTWNEKLCKEHEEKMINILTEACYSI